MIYLIGEIVPIHFEVQVAGVDTDATTVTITLVHPDGATETLTPAHDGTGIYDESYDSTGKPAGRYTWVAFATGAAQAVAAGGWDLIDPIVSSSPLTLIPSWTDAVAIRQLPGCSTLDQRILDSAARAASNILYRLSGRQFTGRLTGYVRPNARPRGFDVRSWGQLGGFGWYGSWGTCGYAYGTGFGAASLAAWGGHSCQAYPAEVDLGAYPITAITAVKIDGTTIPANEYRVDDYRLLVRVRPTETAVPTVRDGWPTCQRLDLPDTQPGTFSVRFAYGAPPPPDGVDAATVLAAELALARSGDNDTRLPARVRTIARQGETIMIADPQDVLDQGRTGIPEVDLFLKSVNPARLQRRAAVWSPDIGRARRPTLETP